MANKCNHDILDDFSSRIKKVFIELNDYYFYHGPSDENFGDHRIIGRKKLLRKIQALFTNSEYAAGVYLVTGYRGSGKTSLINKVISSIDSNLKLLKGNPVSYLFAMMLFIVLTFFSYLLVSAKLPDQITSVKPHFLIFIFGSILLLFSAVIILRAKLKKYNGFSDYYSKSTWRIQYGIEKLRILNLFPDGSQKIIKKILTITLKMIFIPFSLLKVFLIKEYYYNYRLNKWFIINWLFIVGFPFIFSSCYLLILGGEKVDYYQYIRIVFLVFYAELGINIMINMFEPVEKDDPNQSVPQQINSYWQCIKKRFLTISNLNRFIFIKLNLGYTSLKEIDILRLLARNLKTEINKYYKRKFIFIRFFINVCIFYLMYIIAFLFYYQSSIYNDHIAIKETLGIKYLMPSQQAEFLKRNSDSCQTMIFTDINKKIKLISAYENDCIKTRAIIQNNNIYQHKTIVEYIWEKISNTVQYSIMMLDGFLYVGYSHFREFLFKGCFLNIAGRGYIGENYNNYYSESFTPIPKHLDYFFILYIVLIYQIIRRLIISRIFKITSPRLVMKMVNELNEIIVSEITTENIGIGKEKSGFSLVSFLSPRSRKRTIADVREIEKYLIEILDEIDKIRFPFSKPHITVILDELDKIETHTQAIFSRKNENLSNHDGTNSFSKIPNPSFTIDSTRERQQTLQLLLSNLKYFLGDAKAKFVFIAGREMFDASLADISDRNYFMGSIFHDVIYVDSFFCDDLDEKPSDITSMIEYYVCQFLIPHNYRPSQKFQDHKAPFNLRTFNQYILDTFPEFNEHARGLKVADKIIARQKREKVISIIQQFIIYLTHASNGAPKKITNYFENFVEFRVLEKEYAANQILLTTFNDYHRKEHPYLVFNYNKQYEIGLINYITVPIVLSISNHIKNYGDKILVSATYLFDHLLKFHRNGFSWRNIEYIPEIIEINRTPELRAFITNIIHFLCQTHLQTLVSGLYNFRFNQKLSNEIAFLSKISEEASAAFNFTLDESLAIKYYYHSLLFRLEERYKKITSERTEYVHSIALTHSIIGDLYFYDEEYNDAILEYLDSVQYLRYSDFSEENISLLLILIRNMLKLGLAFEKRKTYDSAYETYKELCYLLIKYRDIDLGELGLEEKKIHDEIILATPIYERYTNKKLGSKRSKDTQIVTDKYELNKKFNENFPTECNDQPWFSYRFSDKEEFINKITSQLNPNIELILCKISSFEGLRLIYQPLLARMQIMEKCIIGGISVTDIYRIEKEFDFLQKAINPKEKFLISIDFYNKLGDILYFKTGRIKPKHPLDPPCKAEDKKCRQNKYITRYFAERGENKSIPNIYDIVNISESDKTYPIECSACLFYTKGLLIFIENLIDFETGKIHSIKQVLTVITNNYNSIITKDYTSIRILAGLISDLADTNLACKKFVIKEIKVSEICAFLKILLLESTQNDIQNNISEAFKSVSSPTSIKGIIFQYYLSAKLYKKVNEAKLYVWHLTRILHLLKQILQSNKYGKPSPLKASITKLELTIFRMGMTTGNYVNELKGLYDQLYESSFIIDFHGKQPTVYYE